MKKQNKKIILRELYSTLEKILQKQLGNTYFKGLFLKKYFLEFIIILKNKLETFTGYKYSQIQDALTIGTLLTIITKFSIVIITDNRIPILINLAFLLFYFLLSLKFNLVYYVRESLAYLLSVILGKRIQFRENGFCDIYYEEDMMKYRVSKSLEKIENTPEALANFIFNYEKVPGLEYDFIEPTENIFNRFFQYVCIFLIYIKLLTLKIPIIFYCIKTILFFTLITNHLLPLTYIISIVLIFSRILLLLSDLTMDNIYHSYHEFKEQDSHWTGEYIEATTIPVNFNNACVFFIWATRALEKNDRKEIYTCNKYYPNRSFVFINETMWNVKYFSKYKYLLINYEDKTGYYVFNLILAFIIIINYKYMMETKYETFQLTSQFLFLNFKNGKVILKNLNNEKPFYPITNKGVKILDSNDPHFGWTCVDQEFQTIYMAVSGTHAPQKNYPLAWPQLLKNSNIADDEKYTINGLVKAYPFKNKSIFETICENIFQHIDLDSKRDSKIECSIYDNVVIDMSLQHALLIHTKEYIELNIELNKYFIPSSPSLLNPNGLMLPHNILISDVPLDMNNRLKITDYNIILFENFLKKRYFENLYEKNFFLMQLNFHKKLKNLDVQNMVIPSYMFENKIRGNKLLLELNNFVAFTKEINNPKVTKHDFPAIANSTNFNLKTSETKNYYHKKTSQNYLLENKKNTDIYNEQRRNQRNKDYIDDD